MNKQRIFMISIGVISCIGAFGHETTRQAHERSLDPREEKSIARAQSIAFAASAQPGATPSGRLRIHLVDARTRDPIPGVVRVTQSNGDPVPLPGLVSRGTKLRNDHPAKNWFV